MSLNALKYSLVFPKLPLPYWLKLGFEGRFWGGVLNQNGSAAPFVPKPVDPRVSPLSGYHLPSWSFHNTTSCFSSWPDWNLKCSSVRQLLLEAFKGEYRCVYCLWTWETLQTSLALVLLPHRWAFMSPNTCLNWAYSPGKWTETPLCLYIFSDVLEMMVYSDIVWMITSIIYFSFLLIVSWGHYFRFCFGHLSCLLDIFTWRLSDDHHLVCQTKTLLIISFWKQEKQQLMQ